MQVARHLTKGWPRIATILAGSSTSVLLQPRRNDSYGVLTGSRKTWPKMRTRNGIIRHQTTLTATIVDADAHQDSMLKVRWEDGEEGVYPNIWLRDNCQCSSCFHPTSLSRQVMLKNLSMSVKCADVKVNNGGEELQVQWTDGHEGTYGANWLKERAFNASQDGQGSQNSRFPCALEKKYWGCELIEDLPSASFPDLLRSDKALLAFLETLEVMGVVRVSDVPLHKAQLNLLTKRVGHLKMTHYGETYLVYNKTDTVNLAYTGASLDLHTDEPYIEHKPGIQLLHVIKQFSGEGGDTLLADGFAAAMKLRNSNPEHFKILTETLVDFVDEGVEGTNKFNAHWRRPTIKLNTDGTIKDINMNQMVRDSHFDVSPDIVVRWYAAILAFRDLLYDENNHITLKLEPGNMIVFDNMRVLHGRRGYSAEEGERLLEGAYWEWDTVRSRRRVLQKELTA